MIFNLSRCVFDSKTSEVKIMCKDSLTAKINRHGELKILTGTIDDYTEIEIETFNLIPIRTETMTLEDDDGEYDEEVSIFIIKEI